MGAIAQQSCGGTLAHGLNGPAPQVERSVADTGAGALVMMRMSGKVAKMRRSKTMRVQRNAHEAFARFRRSFKISQAAVATGGGNTAGPGSAPSVEFDESFSKFSGGFEGTFASTALFYGGLDELIGEPRKDVNAAVREEHCEVSHGFGASDMELTAGASTVRLQGGKW
jgi:hypothetical protein